MGSCNGGGYTHLVMIRRSFEHDWEPVNVWTDRTDAEEFGQLKAENLRQLGWPHATFMVRPLRTYAHAAER